MSGVEASVDAVRDASVEKLLATSATGLMTPKPNLGMLIPINRTK